MHPEIGSDLGDRASDSLCRVGGYAALAWRVAAKQGDRADWVGITAVV
jgi:hypothetical protein